MTLFGRERRDLGLNNPSVPITSDSIVGLLGAGLTTDSGVNISEFTAMRHAAVWRCVTVIAGTIAQLPLKTYHDRSEDARQAVGVPLLLNPYPDVTPYEMWETVLLHMLLWGNAYLLKIPNNLGTEIVRLLPLPPWLVSPYRDQSNGNSTVPWGPKRFRVSWDRSQPLTTDEILHIPGVGYDGYRGLSPIAHMRNQIGAGLAAEEYAGRLFGSGSLMSGILSTDKELDEPQAQQIKLRWRERVAGLAKAHEVAVMDKGLKFTPISMNPDDAQFLQTRQFSVTDIARFFGVPPHLCGDLDKTSSWGAGVAEQSLGFVRYTLSYYMARIEQRLTADEHILPQGTFAEFLAEGILRGDSAARASFYATAVATGWMTRNEVRLIENLPKSADPAMDAFNAGPLPPPPAPGLAPDTGKVPKDV